MAIDVQALQMQLATCPIVIGSDYVHYRGGRYTVAETAIRISNQEIDIIYESRDYFYEYKGVPVPFRWSRPLVEFVEPVAWPDGVVRPRFIPDEKSGK